MMDDRLLVCCIHLRSRANGQPPCSKLLLQKKSPFEKTPAIGVSIHTNLQ